MTALRDLVAVAAAVAIGLLVAEARGWAFPLAEKIIRRATRHLPSEHRERYLDEWRGDLATYESRPISAAVFALSVLWSSRQVALELVPASATDNKNAKTAAEGTPDRSTHKRRSFRNWFDYRVAIRLSRRVHAIQLSLEPMTPQELAPRLERYLYTSA